MTEKKKIPDTWERIDDVLTPKGIKELKKNQVLIFDFEGSKIKLKIMRKYGGIVWAKRIQTFTEDQLKDHDKHDVNTEIIPAFCKTCKVEIL